MSAKRYPIEGPWRGALAILPRPRGEDWLADEISDWHESGIGMVVSLLEPDEIRELGLQNEKAICESSGIEFVSFAIPDRGVPASVRAASGLVQKLDSALAHGRKIAVHCRQGVGRSALIAACLLVASGAEPDAAFESISLARGCNVPDTPEQKRWVADYAQDLAPHSAG